MSSLLVKDNVILEVTQHLVPILGHELLHLPLVHVQHLDGHHPDVHLTERDCPEHLQLGALAVVRQEDVLWDEDISAFNRWGRGPELSSYSFTASLGCVRQDSSACLDR